jgi:hypothetical protein
MARRAVPIAIFAIVAVTHFLGIITSFDSRWSIPTARSLLYQRNADLDEYADLLRANDFYAIERINGHFYSSFPVGASLIAMPVVLVADTLRIRAGDGTIEKFTASLVTALTAVLVYLLARQSLDVAGALFITFIFAFCTAAWSTASRALWQHGPSMLTLTLTLWILTLARRRPWLVQFAGPPLALACVIRPTNAIPAVVLSAFVLIAHRRRVVPYALWMLPIAIPAVGFTLSIYHSVLPPYYAPGKIGHGGTFATALVGTVASPNRGLFVFSPILLLSVYGAWLKLRRDRDLLDGALVVIVLLHWLAVASFPIWWGGHSFGYRLLSDMVPYLVYFLIPVIARFPALSGPRRAALTTAVGVLVAISFAINFRGANTRAVYRWNSEPVNVDTVPSRVWDWRDPQFLRELRPGAARR